MQHTVLILNPSSGISGDKMLSCMAALGIDERFMNAVMKDAGIGNEVHAHITVEERKGIRGSRVTLEFISPRDRTPDEMKRLIRGSGLGAAVRRHAAAIIGNLVDAEAAVHGRGKRHVHFHELAHPDTIADAVITASAVEYLGIRTIVTTSINVGYGDTETEHGIYPVPPPAVGLLLKGYPWHFGVTGDGELTTPTGAAIIRALARPLAPGARSTQGKAVYGLGMTELPRRANVLQAFLSQRCPSGR